MGFIADTFSGGSSGGLDYRAQPASIIQPTTTDQTSQAYGQTQAGLAQQQQFINALMGQNGLANQSNVFGQTQGLANQYQDLANGVGPNPALQQLQNTTGQNIANQTAMMAGQRGANANVGLMARQAAMMGGNLQQQAVGQGAELQARQQLAGMSGLQNQQNMMGQMAGQQVGQLASGVMGFNQAAQSSQQNLLNSMAQANNANVGMQSNINNAQAGIANTAAQGQQKMAGGFFGTLGGGSMGATAMFAQGGAVKGYDMGGAVQGPQSYAGQFLLGSAPSNQTAVTLGPVVSPSFSNAIDTSQSDKKAYDAGSNYMKKLIGKPAGSAEQSIGTTEGIDAGGGASSASEAAAGAGEAADIAGALSKGGKVPRHFDEGGGVEPTDLLKLAPLLIALMNKGGSVNGEQLAAQGRLVPGNAKIKGDSYQNDTVPARLSPGEIVIPRHVVQSADPVGNSAKFVAAIIAKNGMRK